MVNFCCEIFLLCFATTVLTFFIAGLLFICASSTSITWERTPHPVRRPAFSSHLFSSSDIWAKISDWEPKTKANWGGRHEVLPCPRFSHHNRSGLLPNQR